MSEEKPKYFIFRVYSEKEMPDYDDKYRIRFYGWTSSKNVIKAFFKQRNRDKYKVRKVFDDELSLVYSDTDVGLDMLVDFVKLKSVSTGEEIEFFTTMLEMQETEKKIHSYFRELCKIVTYDDGEILLELYRHIETFYWEALDFLGFDPPELEAIFDQVGYGESLTSDDMMDDLIDSAYTNGSPIETYKRDGVIPGLHSFTKVSDKILYSLESFILILKDDL